MSLEVHDDYTKIISGDRTIVVVDSGEAGAQHQAPESLGTTWLGNIRTALRLPPIQIAKSEVKLPLDGRMRITTLGSQVDETLLENSDPAVVTAMHKRDALYIRAVALGHSTITLRGPTTDQKLQVDVEPSAATFPQTIEVSVTGDPASVETVQGTVECALRTKLPCLSGADLKFTTPKAHELALEGTATYTTMVSASAPNAFAAEGKVEVEVHNLPLSRREESALWYSNDPEKVTDPANLFAARLEQDVPVRFLYHHMNAGDETLVFEARVLNDTNLPAEVQIIPGDSKPEQNPVLAGLKAGDQFLRNWINNSGEIVTIPPMSEMPISVRHALPKDTVSGLCYLRLLSGGPDGLTVRMDALDPSTIDNQLTAGFKTSKPWHVLGLPKLNDKDSNVRFSHEVYPSPFKIQDISYRVGGKYGFAQIGQRPLESLDTRQKLEGNFGVVYTFHVNVVNPTAQPADVVINFESNAGYSGGFFIVDGRVVRTHLLQPKEEAQIDRFHVDAGESCQVTILTCPLSGGSYPATIAVLAPDAPMAGLAPK
jgi:hypothetical protein